MRGRSVTDAVSMMLDLLPIASIAAIIVMLFFRHKQFRADKKHLLEEIESFRNKTSQKGESL